MRSQSGMAALQLDVYRFRGKSGLLQIVLGLLTLRTFRPIVTLRLIGWIRQSDLPLPLPLAWVIVFPLKILHRTFCAVAGIDFPSATNIGPGFCITHGWGLVVSSGARIGANCTVFHGVTIGRRDKILDNGDRVTGFPTLEDECWIGPGACVLGDIRIGRGSIIGAGAIVVKDVPAHSIVVGNPARVVQSDARPDVFNRADV